MGRIILMMTFVPIDIGRSLSERNWFFSENPLIFGSFQVELQRIEM